MSEPEFFVRAVAESFYLIVVDNEIAIRTKQVIGHQICILRGCEYLTIKFEQEFTCLEGELEMVECIKLVDKEKGLIFHSFDPVEQQFQCLGSGGNDRIEKNYLAHQLRRTSSCHLEQGQQI